MKALYIMIFFLLGWVHPVQAEPNPSARFLMNEPVSLLDFGIYKLEKDIKGLQKDLTIHYTDPFDISVDYKWDENRIVIQLTYGYEGNPPRKTLQVGIKNVFRLVKSFLGVNPKGEVYHKRGNSKVADYFSHKGYIVKNRPKVLEKEIDKMIEVRVTYSVQNYSRIFECKNMLVGSSIDELVCTD